MAARVFSAASGAVLVVVLAGCSLGDSAQEASSGIATHSAPADSQPTDPSNNPPHDDPPAFHFESGDLVLGDFTYEDVAGNIFNPCEEISVEEFAAIGFEKEGKVRRVETKDLYGCAIYAIEDDSLSFAVSGGSGNLSNTTEQRHIVDSDASKSMPGVYTYENQGDEGVCGAAVDTKRGQLGVTAGRLRADLPNEYFCEDAVRVLDELYKLNK
ncbi:DUF3558 family protein [Corynebacterium urinipleomorphum]|uniref:DUF3558 family protein n=1 Tax=Corynebacterium urinipleomorphum TaxID=1852380 RepID=UPI00138FE74D|nr:DUF3558 family protein [Corynebacterium urinipleomorphum]